MTSIIFQTIEISQKYTKLHAELTPKIVALMKRAVETGEPINPPIWWVDPLNAQAHKIYDGKNRISYFLAKI